MIVSTRARQDGPHDGLSNFNSQFIQAFGGGFRWADWSRSTMIYDYKGSAIGRIWVRISQRLHLVSQEPDGPPGTLYLKTYCKNASQPSLIPAARPYQRELVYSPLWFWGFF